MNARIPGLCLLVLLAAAAAGAATWETTLESPIDGAVLTVAVGEPLLSLDGVRVRLTGYDKLGGYFCDSPESDGFFLPETLYFLGTFGQAGDQDDLNLTNADFVDDIEGYEFDVLFEFDLADGEAWAFLADGAAEFTLSWFREDPSDPGWCQHVYSSFILYSVTLSIDYNSSVPTDRSSWDEVKAAFRD